jgi:1-acyl-sn-glycerol-3-phosphate acyltransferase
VRERVGRALMRVLRYRIVGEAPPADGVYILVAAPHTSWLDFPLMLGIAWGSGIRPGFLAKKELFQAPFGGVMRGLGGIAVDRENPGTLVDDLVSRARSGEPFALVIAPEGTRAKGDRWKSGFYRIARSADIPLVLAYLDGPTRTGGFGPTIHPSGDLRADMDLVRAFYADKHGVKPEGRTTARLSDEGEGADGPS